VSFLQSQLEDPVRFARIKRWSYAILAAVALSEVVGLFVFHGDHSHFWFEGIPAFGSLYGFVSCVVIIVVSKFLGKVWLMRGEDYYES